MRLPISGFIEWAETKEIFKSDAERDPFSISHRKNLNVSVERGEGLKKNANLFVYFSVQNEDFFT